MTTTRDERDERDERDDVRGHGAQGVFLSERELYPGPKGDIGDRNGAVVGPLRVGRVVQVTLIPVALAIAPGPRLFP